MALCKRRSEMKREWDENRGSDESGVLREEMEE
jgi:hypothetical protein